MPVTPATELLLAPRWIEHARSKWAQSDAADEWRAFLIMIDAVVDPDAAWRSAQDLARYDNGNSRTNTLYWIATRGRNGDDDRSDNDKSGDSDGGAFDDAPRQRGRPARASHAAATQLLPTWLMIIIAVFVVLCGVGAFHGVRARRSGPKYVSPAASRGAASREAAERLLGMEENVEPPTEADGRDAAAGGDYQLMP